MDIYDEKIRQLDNELNRLNHEIYLLKRKEKQRQLLEEREQKIAINKYEKSYKSTKLFSFPKKIKVKK